MLADTDKEIKKKKSEIRRGKPFEDTKYCSFIVPKINFDAAD